MLNPANLRITLQGKDNQNISPFVGIQKAKDGEMEFCLPFGFDDFPVGEPQKVTKFFFDLYKTFQHFQEYVKDNFERKSSNADGSLKKERGYTFTNKDNESVTLYSKIANLESVLAGYDELRIFNIVMRPRRTIQIDYSQISKYLHQAVFSKNHIPYVDEMVLPQPFIEYTITDLVKMYCYVYLEIKYQLEEEESIPPEIKNQAQFFREYHLQPDSSLFSPNHDFTIQLLRSVLDDIHQQVSLKDDDYWHFYKALEDFLYGVPNSSSDEGIFWGITSFALVWEDMCLFYVHHNDWSGVWYADSPRFANTKIKGHKVFLDAAFENPFYFKLNEESRYLRPDLVRKVNKADDWFERTFKIDLKGHSCHVVLKDPTQLSFFNYAIDPELSSKGMMQKNKNAKSFIYLPVTKEKLEKAIAITKAKYLKHNPSALPHHLLTDFKYINFAAFEQKKLPSKILHDINKQLIYEYAINLNSPDNLSEVKSQFIIPYFPQNQINKLNIQVIDNSLLEKGIEVWKVNYMFIQKFYNSHLTLQKENQ